MKYCTNIILQNQHGMNNQWPNTQNQCWVQPVDGTVECNKLFSQLPVNGAFWIWVPDITVFTACAFSRNSEPVCIGVSMYSRIVGVSHNLVTDFGWLVQEIQHNKTSTTHLPGGPSLLQQA
jgi:hypothetical protein